VSIDVEDPAAASAAARSASSSSDGADAAAAVRYVDGAVDFDEFLSTNALSHEDLERLATLPDSRQSALLPRDALAKARGRAPRRDAKKQLRYVGGFLDDDDADAALDECRVFPRPTFRARGLA